MNSFLTHLVRGDHSLHLAAHLAAGILCLLLLSGAAQPSKPAAPAPSQTVTVQVASAPTLVVASSSR
jgi:predicted component of type VI protein secretion system